MAAADSKPYGIVYCIEHVSSGRVYIGQTTADLADRWSAHKKDKCCSRLHRAIHKYGEMAFSKKILDTAGSKEELNEKEIFHIERFGSTNRERGFNLRQGGSFGKHSEESKQKMSISVRKAYEDPAFKAKLSLARTGIKASEETRKKRSIALSGREFSDAAKKKMSKAKLDNWGSEQYRSAIARGQAIARESPEYVDKVSLNTKAQWANPEKRKKLLESLACSKAAKKMAGTYHWDDPVKKAAILAKRAATATKKRSQLS